MGFHIGLGIRACNKSIARDSHTIAQGVRFRNEAQGVHAIQTRTARALHSSFPSCRPFWTYGGFSVFSSLAIIVVGHRTGAAWGT